MQIITYINLDPKRGKRSKFFQYSDNIRIFFYFSGSIDHEDDFKLPAAHAKIPSDTINTSKQ